MGIFDTYSKRLKKQQRAGQPDVYRYDDLPREFCIQVIHIWRDAIGPIFTYDRWSSVPPPNIWWGEIHAQMARELGVFELSKKGHDHFTNCQIFLQEAEVAQALDLIELTFGFIDSQVRAFIAQDWERVGRSFLKISPDQAIDELNQRFREHAIGYEFVDGKIIRKDSQLVHAEVVQPALHLLADGKFRGANEEFLRAHEHYRQGRHEEAIQDALKALESTLKTICDRRKWAYQPGSTAKTLIGIVLENDLVPKFLTAEFSALAAVLESGLPAVRNKVAGHGTGAEPREIPAYFAAFALHLAASNIVMLVEAHRATK